MSNRHSLNTLISLLLLTLPLLASGCSKNEEPIEINMEKIETTEKAAAKPGNVRPVRMAIGGMITPREGFAYYKQLLNYIEKQINIPIKLVDRENYSEINEMIKAGELDAAFVCGGPYVDGKEESTMELLAAPRAYGETVYYSYIIVPSDSDAATLDDLRGRRFAFTDPLSNSGKISPTYMLSKIGETPEHFFRETAFTYAHDKSIEAVARKTVDAAAVDSLVWEYANRKNPEFTSKTKVILKSPPYGIPPVVARTSLDPEIKNILRQAFLDVHKSPEGRKILKNMMIEEFVKVEDSAYESIREMKAWLSSNGEK